MHLETRDAPLRSSVKRLVVPDVLRGVAIVAMLIAHAVPMLPEVPRALSFVMGNINSLASPLFRELWARHDVGVLSGSPAVQLDHPLVGQLELNREKLLVAGTDNVMLVIYHPDAGSDAPEKLGMLASYAAADRSPTARRRNPESTIGGVL